MKKLSDISDKNPFKVPVNYFEEVNKRIIDAALDSEKAVITGRVHSRFRTYLLIAASVAGFILIGYTTHRLLSPANKDIQVSKALYELNPDSYINDIDITSLEENVPSYIMSEEVHDINKSDIIDYLILENIEINDIYEHL